jgi:hypothetical protein
MSDDWRSHIPRREEGETLEHYEAQLRCLQRISDWSDPEYLLVLRDGKPVEPAVEPDRTELRKRIVQLPWARPKR